MIQVLHLVENAAVAKSRFWALKSCDANGILLGVLGDGATKGIVSPENEMYIVTLLSKKYLVVAILS